MVAQAGGVRNDVEPAGRFFRKTNPDRLEDGAEQLRLI
jgi:hypothetical protein